MISGSHSLRLLLFAVLLSAVQSVSGQSTPPPPGVAEFLDRYCLDCHDSAMAKGNLNLETASFDLGQPGLFEKWVLIHDRVQGDEMPPEKKDRPEKHDLKQFLETVSTLLIQAEKQRVSDQGRAKVRRVNRLEYENTLRELLNAPWLMVADQLPEDGTAHLFNKVGDRLDVSHIQMAKYLEAAERSLRAAAQAAAFRSTTNRFYAREEPVMQNYLRYRFGQTAATRAVIPLIGTTPQPEVVRGKQPVTVGETDPALREREAFGVVSGTYTATTKYDFTRMEVPVDGRYRIRMKTYTFTAGPNGRSGGDDHGLTGGNPAWWRPSRTEAFPGTRSEPVTVYALASSGDSRWLTTFDSFPEPSVIEREVFLKRNEKIRPDATRLVRTRPGWRGNPNATTNGVPGFAMNWLELEGPLHEDWPPLSYQALFGDLPYTVNEEGEVKVQPAQPNDDARALIADFMNRAYRRNSLKDSSVQTFLDIFKRAETLGHDFTDAMVTAFASVLCSTEFLYLETQPGPLNNEALASRLSYFLWNGPPDEALLHCAALSQSPVLKEQTERLLNDPRAQRFIDAFLDYWLDLRDINANSPDAELYPDYYLDDQLTESSIRETRSFFRELIDKDLPARNLVDSDFAFVNERLAGHYGLPAFEGVEPRRVELPKDSPRGGLITQASVLRVTANGTTTSPVVRGAWVMERIMGLDIPPPPSGVEAIEPDIRGATTIREQLDKHRQAPACASCHVRFDPVGFALESFDIAGGWREAYRAVGEGGEPPSGFGKNGHEFKFHYAQPVDCAGELQNGRAFDDVAGLKKILASDERRLARALLKHLIVYATGAPVSFGDRPEVERMLDQCQEKEYGVRSLMHALVQSEMFLNK